MAVDKTSYNGEEKDSLFISTLSPWPQQTDNGSGTAWHGMAWHGGGDKGFFAVHLPCRQTGDATYDRDRSLSFLFGHLLTLVAVNLWLMAISRAPILTWIALKGPCGP